MYGLLNYLSRPGMQQMGGMMRPQGMMPPQSLLGALSNQGKLVQPPPMMPVENGAAQALQGAQQNAVIMPAKKKEGGAGGMDKAMTLLKLMGIGG